MMKKKQNLLCGELIGETIKIVESSNHSLEGIEGEIINETKYTFQIKTKQKQKRILKNQIKLIFIKHHLTIDGKDLVSRPEERTKKWLMKRKTML